MRFAVLFSCLLLWAAPAQAQAVGQDLGRFDVSVLGGVMDGARELGWHTDMEQAPAFGGAFTYWAAPWFGLRARALYSNFDVMTTDPTLSKQDPSALLTLGDIVLRRSHQAGGMNLLPYVAGGVGIKRYAFDEADRSHYAAAGGLGGGLEARFGRIGLFGEASHIFAEFETMGFKDWTRDWVFAGGITFGLDRPARMRVSSAGESM